MHFPKIMTSSSSLPRNGCNWRRWRLTIFVAIWRSALVSCPIIFQLQWRLQTLLPQPPTAMRAWSFYHHFAAAFCLHYREGLERIDEQDIGEYGRIAPLLWISVAECQRALTEETAKALAVAMSEASQEPALGGLRRMSTTETMGAAAEAEHRKILRCGSWIKKRGHMELFEERDVVSR